MPGWLRPARTTALAALLVLIAEPLHPAAVGAPSRVVPSADAATASFVPPPAFYRPVVLGGKAFPVARSNFLSLLDFGNGWHAPRFRLVDGSWRLVGRHEGIDISAEQGTPVLSMTGGVVAATGWTFYSGTRVGVRGDDGRYYLYAHLSSVEPGIVPGARVGPGSPLGAIGNTGYGPPGQRDVFVPHLHFGIQAADGSRWLNPYPTLVRLYERTVLVHQRWERRLRRLAAQGRERAWDRETARRYVFLVDGRE